MFDTDVLEQGGHPVQELYTIRSLIQNDRPKMRLREVPSTSNRHKTTKKQSSDGLKFDGVQYACEKMQGKRVSGGSKELKRFATVADNQRLFKSSQTRFGPPLLDLDKLHYWLQTNY